jgi:hypothetical protein
MEPHELKNRDKTRVKKRGEMMDDKKPNRKIYIMPKIRPMLILNIIPK